MVAFTGEIHPVADLFPMLADDELVDLAESIAARGLDHPIVLDADGRLLDGRNRLAACDKAGVEPRFETYDGDDADDYALRNGITRRHMTKGQQAMVTARATRVTGNLSLRGAADAASLNRERVRVAAVVLDHAPDLADAVVTGATSLDSAYETARDRKKAAESTEGQMARLRAETPDLADLVVEERMSLAEAVAAAKQRVTERADAVRRQADWLADFLRGWDAFAHLSANPLRVEVLDALSDHDRERLLAIEEEVSR